MEDIKMKTCKVCKMEKELTKNFYKNRKSYSPLCKICYTKRSSKRLKDKPVYVKKGSGFNKLPLELKKQIIQDIKDGLNCSKIYKKHNEKYNQLKYKTLTAWKRNGTIKL